MEDAQSYIISAHVGGTFEVASKQFPQLLTSFGDYALLFCLNDKQYPSLAQEDTCNHQRNAPQTLA